jgi:hypothetical protein
MYLKIIGQKYRKTLENKSRDQITLNTLNSFHHPRFPLYVLLSRKAKVRYALVGGHAVVLHGAVRGTVDIVIAFRKKSL